MTESVKVLILILALILSGFVTLVQGQSLAPVSADDAQKWRVDLHYLSVEMPKRHNNLFHSMTREQFDSLLAAQGQSDVRHAVSVGGADLRTVQQWLGHSDIESPMRYLKPSQSAGA